VVGSLGATPVAMPVGWPNPMVLKVDFQTRREAVL
jgi:hypothetical protein